MPGRSRTGSRPSRTVMSLASYDARSRCSRLPPLSSAPRTRPFSSCSDREDARPDTGSREDLLSCVTDGSQSTRRGSPRAKSGAPARPSWRDGCFRRGAPACYRRTSRIEALEGVLAHPCTIAQTAEDVGAQVPHLRRPGRVVRAHHERRTVHAHGRTCAATRPHDLVPRPKTTPTTSARPAPSGSADRPPHDVPDAHRPSRDAAVTAQSTLRARPSIRHAAHWRAPSAGSDPPSTDPVGMDHRGRVDGRGEQDLAGGSSSTRAAARCGVELGEHVVEEQHGAARAVAAAQLVRGQAQGQGHAALLALRGVGACGRAPMDELEVVAVRAHRRDPTQTSSARARRSASSQGSRPRAPVAEGHGRPRLRPRPGARRPLGRRP